VSDHDDGTNIVSQPVGSVPHFESVVLDLGLGVTVELPTAWTPIERFMVPLVSAWAERQAHVVAHGEAVAAGAEGDGRILSLWRRSWWELLFELWRDDRIETAARRDILSDLIPLDFPRVARRSHKFLGPDADAEFRYLPDSMLFHDLHARAILGGTRLG
jgi:hypothetical protein